MENERSLVVFEKHGIRRVYDEKSETWFFSVIDVVGALTDSANPRDYWFKMKIRVKTEDGFELSTICRQLKLKAPDGKMRETDCASVEGLFRIIQSIPSPKAEPFKQWLAKVGYERIQDMSDPARSLDRAREYWKQHKSMKGLKTQNLRDHMSEAELILTALAELSTRQIAETVQATGVPENAEAGRKGGAIARNARRELEAKTGRKVVTGESFLPPTKRPTRRGESDDES